MVTARRFGTIVVATSALSLLSACDPPPPPAPSFHVTSVTHGDDAAPGDGSCETARGNGVCTLDAAVQEGNALGRADVHLSEVTDDAHLLSETEITGELTLISTHVPMSNPMATIMAPGLHIRPGATLRLHRLLLVSPEGGGDPYVVDGSLVVDRALIRGEIDVSSGGALIVDNGYLLTDWRLPGADRAAIVNHGVVWATHSAFAATEDVPVVETKSGGTTVLAASAVDRNGASGPAPDCDGIPATSLGYNLTAGCGFTAIGDIERTPEHHYDGESLTDRIPLGTLGCGTAVDVAGDVRPVDYDLDGVAACDIGPTEHQPGSW